MILRLTAYLLLMTATLLSCTRRPLQLSDFEELDISQGWREGVELALDMEDTVNTCMLEICMQIKNSQRVNNVDTFAVTIDIVSPEQLHYSERIALPTSTTENNTPYTLTNGIRNYRWTYRRGINNRISGRWMFTLTPSGTNVQQKEIYKEIIGVGISCKKENNQ